MKRNKRGEIYISCLASNYKQPIAVLVERLLTVQLSDSPDGKPREPEVDYATTLVVMLVLQFEAWVSRARHFDGGVQAANSDKKKYVLPWIESLNDPSLKPIISRLEEIYFLRDAIVHNHIWTYTQSWVQGSAHYSNFDLDRTWQSSPKKLSNIVKGKLPLPSFPRTKLLNLMVVPGFVGRKDVAIVFKTVKDALKLLDELGHLKIAPKISYVRFGEKLSFPFWSLIGKIQKSFLGKLRTDA
ncbi:MAG: hypothetical protein Q8O58_09440 [Gallionella sp.]|nr:hypothetical protein [Gallionella sp.]